MKIHEERNNSIAEAKVILLICGWKEVKRREEMLSSYLNEKVEDYENIEVEVDQKLEYQE